MWCRAWLMIKHGGIFLGDITLDVSSGRSDLNFILYWLARGSICRVLWKNYRERLSYQKSLFRIESKLFTQRRCSHILKPFQAHITYLLSTPFWASHYRFLFSISSHEFTYRVLHVIASRAPGALVISIADATHISTRGNCSRHHPSESFMMWKVSFFPQRASFKTRLCWVECHDPRHANVSPQINDAEQQDKE